MSPATKARQVVHATAPHGRSPSGKPWAVKLRAGECCKPVDERDEHLVAWPCCRVAGHEGPCDAVPFGGP